MVVEKMYYHIQKAKSDHILSIDLSSPFIIKGSSLNNPEYGKGKQVKYDFERIQYNVITQLNNKKFLDIT
jgi:hypothetical protein